MVDASPTSMYTRLEHIAEAYMKIFQSECCWYCTIRHMYHFTRYIFAICKPSFSLSLTLNKMPQSISSKRGGKKICEQCSDKEPKLCRCCCCCCCLVWHSSPRVKKMIVVLVSFVRSLARRAPMMILNNDENNGANKKRQKNVQNFLIKIIDCSQGIPYFGELPAGAHSRTHRTWLIDGNWNTESKQFSLLIS